MSVLDGRARSISEERARTLLQLLKAGRLDGLLSSGPLTLRLNTSVADGGNASESPLRPTAESRHPAMRSHYQIDGRRLACAREHRPPAWPMLLPFPVSPSASRSEGNQPGAWCDERLRGTTPLSRRNARPRRTAPTTDSPPEPPPPAIGPAHRQGRRARSVQAARRCEVKGRVRQRKAVRCAGARERK